MPAQFWESLLNTPGPWQTGSGVATTTSTADGSIISPSGPDFTLPANWFYPGACLRITAAGRATTGSTTTNVTFALYYGTNASANRLWVSQPIQVGAASTAQVCSWRVQSIVQCRAVGVSASSSLFSYGEIAMNALQTPSATGSCVVQLVPNGTTPVAITTLNTTQATAITLGAWVNQTTGAPSVQCDQFEIESLN